MSERTDNLGPLGATLETDIARILGGPTFFPLGTPATPVAEDVPAAVEGASA